ncbi:MAG: hypothetical protein V8Q32_00190 [Anaerotignum faecicola]
MIFLRKKPAGTAADSGTDREGVLELDGVEVETDAQEADIVLDVEDGQDMNRAVHAVMDEEEIEIDRAGGTLYQENDDIAAAEEEPEVEIELTTEETVAGRRGSLYRRTDRAGGRRSGSGSGKRKRIAGGNS